MPRLTGSASDHWACAERRLRCLPVPALLVVSGLLALRSLVGDSITFDESSHLTAGISYLKTGDFRLAPDHPPLAKLWCAWPLLLMDHRWPASDNQHWRNADVFPLARVWLFELNDGQRLLLVARCMMVVLFLASCLTVYGLARAVFGPSAALVALALAALSPTLLAHGRLVTTDLPITLACGLTLLAYARFLRRATWLRLAAAGLALGAASVTKMSWPLVLPALVTMAAWDALRRGDSEPGDRVDVTTSATEARRSTHQQSHAGQEAATRLSRLERVTIAVGGLLLMLLATPLSIWTCYGWRSTMLAPAATADEQVQLDRTRDRLARNWERALHHPDGTPRTGLTAALLRLAAGSGLLPEAYVFGLAMTLESTESRSAYLMGHYSETGWRAYFPVTFAIKTPLATLILMVAGCVAAACSRVRCRDLVLLAGLIVFGVVYAGYAVNSRFNIGHRHLLPIYPVVFVLGGASVGWLSSWTGRGLVGVALVWLLAANIRIHPHYLAYFNELIGGPARGHYYLADSNIDWGQDLLRLARYAREHPTEPIKLAYFGSALPTYYVDCTALPSNYSFEPRAELTAGTYVVSVTQLLGVYDYEIRDAFWNDRTLEAYRILAQLASAERIPDEPEERRQQRLQAAQEYAELRQKRLLNRLAHRPPDERIGYSLFLYRLSDSDIDRLTAP